MTTSLKQIEEQMLALSAEERVRLADSLLNLMRLRSLRAQKSWAAMMKKRMAAAARGDDSSCIDPEVFAEVRRLSREEGEIQRTGERQVLDTFGCTTQ